VSGLFDNASPPIHAVSFLEASDFFKKYEFLVSITDEAANEERVQLLYSN
jgi:hypothetical protein